MLIKASKRLMLAQESIAEFLVLPIPTVSHRFSIMNAHASVDIYAGFRLESVHGLALGLLKVLKECLVNYPLDPSIVATTIRYRSGQTKPFRRINMFTPNLMKKFLNLIKRHFCTSVLREDLCRD